MDMSKHVLNAIQELEQQIETLTSIVYMLKGLSNLTPRRGRPPKNQDVVRVKRPYNRKPKPVVETVQTEAVVAPKKATKKAVKKAAK